MTYMINGPAVECNLELDIDPLSIADQKLPLGANALAQAQGVDGRYILLIALSSEACVELRQPRNHESLVWAAANHTLHNARSGNVITLGLS